MKSLKLNLFIFGFVTMFNSYGFTVKGDPNGNGMCSVTCLKQIVKKVPYGEQISYDPLVTAAGYSGPCNNLPAGGGCPAGFASPRIIKKSSVLKLKKPTLNRNNQ
jgi:hypothetical protein